MMIPSSRAQHQILSSESDRRRNRPGSAPLPWLDHPRLTNKDHEALGAGVGLGDESALVVVRAIARTPCWETSSKSLEALVKNTGKESLQWGLAAGIYSGLTYGLKEARGTHDWKNSAVAGTITGMALTMDDTSHEQMVQSAITGAAISTTAHLLSGIF